MPVPNRPNGLLAYPRGSRQFLRWDFPEHVIQQIQPRVLVSLLNLIPNVDDLVFHIFEEVAFLADVSDETASTARRASNPPVR
jgi:hypothetical protein